ncbi:RHS domain-containing protein [Cronobacter dublinensis]|nr:RHS domain-containing protein [Cronobacter dublinensis]NCH73645.1 hypothetical protein [Cronobacter dublinensis]
MHKPWVAVVPEITRSGRQEQHENGQCITRIYDPNEVWSPLARVDHLREDRTGEIYWFSTDLNGAPLEVTDVEGNLRWSGQYGSFGEVRHQTDGFTRLARNTTLTHQPLRYAGQYADSETGLHYNLFRYYDPQVGRYIVQDPLGMTGGLNLYQYAPNPIMSIDPLGLITVYRNLRPDEDVNKGLSARLPGRDMSPAGHVRNGSKATFKGSQYISTTTDPAVVERWREPGQVTVSFDTDDVIPDVTGQRKVIDLSTEDKALAAGLKAPATHYSVSSREVLIVGRVEKAKLNISCGGQK